MKARKSETVAEQPAVKAEDQPYISYGKAPLVLFALQELIGANKGQRRSSGPLHAFHGNEAGMVAVGPFHLMIDRRRENNPLRLPPR